MKGVPRKSKCLDIICFSYGVLRYFTQIGRPTFFGVFSDAFPGHKMRVHLPTAYLSFGWSPILKYYPCPILADFGNLMAHSMSNVTSKIIAISEDNWWLPKCR
jgi:hypothetical protein